MTDRIGVFGAAGVAPAAGPGPAFGSSVAVGLRARMHPVNAGADRAWGDPSREPRNIVAPWPVGDGETAAGVTREVDVLGAGFGVRGTVSSGQFDRLSDWLNAQTGFVQVREGSEIGPEATRVGERRRDLWIRLDQVALVGQRATDPASRPGAPIVRKQRVPVSISTSSFRLVGFVHVYAHDSMSEFLESPDPQFLPMTDVSVRTLEDSRPVGRYSFAMLNRRQIVAIADDSSDAGPDPAGTDAVELRGRDAA